MSIISIPTIVCGWWWSLFEQRRTLKHKKTRSKKRKKETFPIFPIERIAPENKFNFIPNDNNGTESQKIFKLELVEFGKSSQTLLLDKQEKKEEKFLFRTFHIQTLTETPTYKLPVYAFNLPPTQEGIEREWCQDLWFLHLLKKVYKN